MRLSLLFFLSSFALLAQPDVSGITQPAGGTNPTIIIANEAGTGTTVNTITTLTGAPSTAIISTAAATGKFVGICSSGCGTTGSATITLMGRIGCVFDGGTTANDYVQQSASANGKCTDAGATYPITGQVMGRVVSTNGGAGTYDVDLFPSEIQASSGGGGAGSTLFTYVNATGTGPNDSNAETSLIGTATTGSKTIPANTMIAGQLLQAVVTGQITTPVSPDNLTLNMYMGATLVATRTITGAHIASLTTESFNLKASFFILTGGAACAVLVEDMSLISASGVATGDLKKFQGTGTTFDCTATQAFDVKAQWGAAQVGESVFGQGVGLYIPGAPVTSVNGRTGAVTVVEFFQTLTPPAHASFTAQNFNTGAGVTTTQTNNTYPPATSITLDQHDPSATKNIVALDKAVISSKSFTLTEAFSMAPSAGTNTAYGLYLSDGGSRPNIILFGMQAGQTTNANLVL